jgi:hypothetical protein
MIKSPTPEEMIILRRIAFKFVDAEVAIRGELKDIYRSDEISLYISMALVNFAGNFIFHNSPDKKQRTLNAENFVKNFAIWFSEAEKNKEKH